MNRSGERGFARRLLHWFDEHGRRDLPWQQDRSPYRVWISEVMLQQTQVTTVIPYFERFVARFPDVQSLAAASLDEILHLWTGLGYYARARNLHATARIVVERHGGEFPRSMAVVQDLPGIGRSTAGAILALACEQRHPILDGNVKRVLARAFGIAGDPTSARVVEVLWSRSESCTPTERVADYTQAVMDLGATVCTRNRPACDRCPLRADCVARRENRIEALPGRKQVRRRQTRSVTLLLIEAVCDGESMILLERRPTHGVWGGLWSPPEFASESEAFAWCGRELAPVSRLATSLAPIDHGFTHFDLRLSPLHVRCDRGAPVQDRDDRLWYSLQAPPRVGLPQPIRELLRELGTRSDISS